MSSELIPRVPVLPRWARESSRIGKTSREIVAAALSLDHVPLPLDRRATCVAFPSGALEADGAIIDIGHGLDRASLGDHTRLPPWARVAQHDGRGLRVGSTERVAVHWHDGVTAKALEHLLATSGDRLAFLDVVFPDTASALVSLIAPWPNVIGLVAECLVEEPEDPLAALSTLTHLHYLDTSGSGTPTTRASTLRRLSDLKDLRFLGLDFAYAFDLHLLDGLPRLRLLRVWLEAGSGEWCPSLPELRRLVVTPFPAPNQPWRLPRLDDCPQLESLSVDWSGRADQILHAAEGLPQLRDLTIGHMGGASLSAASIERLATLVRLRTLKMHSGGYLEVPGGLLRRLDTLTALETLSLGLVGATAADVEWLTERLPSASLNLSLLEMLGTFVYDSAHLLARVEYSISEQAAGIVWTSD